MFNLVIRGITWYFVILRFLLCPGRVTSDPRVTSGRSVLPVVFPQSSPVRPPAVMARGHQKIQSQKKNAEKQAKMKKQQGHDQKSAAGKALIYQCVVCKTQMPDPKTYKQHFESKHPKAPMPEEIKNVAA